MQKRFQETVIYLQLEFSNQKDPFCKKRDAKSPEGRLILHCKATLTNLLKFILALGSLCSSMCLMQILGKKLKSVLRGNLVYFRLLLRSEISGIYFICLYFMLSKILPYFQLFLHVFLECTYSTLHWVIVKGTTAPHRLTSFYIYTAAQNKTALIHHSSQSTIIYYLLFSKRLNQVIKYVICHVLLVQLTI